MPLCREKLSVVDDNISAVEKASDEDMKALEEKRTVMISAVNKIFDERKRKRLEYTREKSTKLKELHNKIKAKIEHIDKMTTSLETNIGAYSDYDLIEMELEMLTALREVETYNVKIAKPEIIFVPGEINQQALEGMIGTVEETTFTNIDDKVSVEQVKTIKDFNVSIRTIAPISHSQAWVRNTKSNDIKLLSSQSTETTSYSLPPNADFIVLSNGDFIVSDFKNQEIRRVLKSTGEGSVIVKTKPLHPTFISKIKTDNILISLRDNGDKYKLKPSSRRLVQRISLAGKVLHSYEFQEDGITRLFTYPRKTAENGNANICAINCTSNGTGELIVLYGDGRVRFTYRGQEGTKFDPTDLACDSERRIIVADFKNNSLHLLNSDGLFFRYLMSNMFECPETVVLYQSNLWIGFYDGTVKVYKYLE